MYSSDLSAPRWKVGKAISRAIRRLPTRLIKADNPKMTDEQIAYGIKRMNELKVVDGGDAETMGIGVMTDARWKATYDFMVAGGLIDKSVDYKKAFTTSSSKT